MFIADVETWPLRKSIVTTRSNPSPKRSVLGHRGARVLVARQTACFNLVSTLEEFFFSNIICSLQIVDSLDFFFFFFNYMTILNCRKLQKFSMMWANILDEWENVAKRKDSLDIFPWCPLNCRYEFLELEAFVFEIYHHQTKEIGNEFLRQQFLEHLFFRMTYTFWFWFPRQLIGYYCKYFYSSQFVWEQNFSSFKLFSKVFR